LCCQRVKIKVKGTGVLVVGWCGLDHGARQFLMSELRLRVPVFVLFCRVSWIIERGNFVLAMHQKLRLRVLVLLLVCGVRWIVEQGNFLCAGYVWLRVKIKAKSTGVHCVLREG